PATGASSCGPTACSPTPAASMSAPASSSSRNIATTASANPCARKRSAGCCDIVGAVRIDDDSGGGLQPDPARPGAQPVIAFVGAVLLALSRLPQDRTLAFAASTTLVGLFILVGAAISGSAARTTGLVRRVRGRGFVGTQPDEGGGSYRQAPRRGMV